MPAPDLPPPPAHDARERPLAVHLHVRVVDPADFAGAVVVVIDQLRASVTITAALAAGAPYIIPTLTVEDARACHARRAGDRPLLGGERGGVRIPGFDLDNSPRAYTRDAVAARPLVFTTSNGTAALLHARHAAEILVGSLANLSALCRRVAPDPRPVHLLCCGTRDQVSLDDVLPAGAMVERLLAAGRAIVADDSARVALAAWRAVSASPDTVEAALRESRGGRNLSIQGLSDDIAFCARVDTFAIVPRFDPDTGRITPARARA